MEWTEGKAGQCFSIEWTAEGTEPFDEDDLTQLPLQADAGRRYRVSRLAREGDGYRRVDRSPLLRTHEDADEWIEEMKKNNPYLLKPVNHNYKRV